MRRVYSADDQRAIKRWFARVIVFYSLVALVVVAFVAVRISFQDPQINARKSATSSDQGLVNRPFANFR